MVILSQSKARNKKELSEENNIFYDILDFTNYTTVVK